MFAYISNEQVNDSISNFENTVNTALNSSLNFIYDVQMVGTSPNIVMVTKLKSHFMQQANTTVDRYDEISTFLQCQVDSKCCVLHIL